MAQSAVIRRNIVESLEATVKRPLEIAGNTKIAADLGLDSLAIMDFIMELEDRLDLSIPLNRIAEVETIDDLVRTIEELKEDAK
ncbi:MAG: acyl carrier protein [Parvibaculaceae bacterium]|nr:acyl carrier protein [Parvibaculaceae bacterium]